MAKKLQMVCSECGSTEVRRNADVAWSVETQEWEIISLFDSATCEDCGGETSIKEVELSS